MSTDYKEIQPPTGLKLFGKDCIVDKTKPIIIQKTICNNKESARLINVPLVYPEVYVQYGYFHDFFELDDFVKYTFWYMGCTRSDRVLIPKNELDSFITNMMIDLFGISTFIIKEVTIGD